MGSRFGELMLFVCSLTWLKQSWAKELKSAVSGFRGFGDWGFGLGLGFWVLFTWLRLSSLP